MTVREIISVLIKNCDDLDQLIAFQHEGKEYEADIRESCAGRIEIEIRVKANV